MSNKLWRLIAPFFYLLVYLLPGAANAALPPLANDETFWWYNQQVGKDFPTPGMACGDYTQDGWQRTGATTQQGWSEYACMFSKNDDPNQPHLPLKSVTASCRYLGDKWTLNSQNGRCYTPNLVEGVCRENELNQNGVCKCKIGFKEDAGVCVNNVVHKCPASGTAAGVWNVPGTCLGQKKVCNTNDSKQGNCMLTGDSNLCAAAVDGKIYYSFNGTYSGGTCTPDDNARGFSISANAGKGSDILGLCHGYTASIMSCVSNPAHLWQKGRQLRCLQGVV